MLMHCVLRNVLGIVFNTLCLPLCFTIFFCNCLLRISFYESCFIVLYVSTRRAPPQRVAGKILVYLKRQSRWVSYRLLSPPKLLQYCISIPLALLRHLHFRCNQF
ncbi:hypothetical protein Hanom_Chr01g00014171 [Helianthus anomalus]